MVEDTRHGETYALVETAFLAIVKSGLYFLIQVQ